MSAANFFSSLVDPSAVLARCEQSPSLKTLSSKRHSADRPGRKQSTELVAWDAAVDEGKSLSAWRAKNVVGFEHSQTADLLEPVYA
ncbi:MAG TPA: hypothetical protein VMT14_11515 [Burkholderiaceae bacterium]|jgi:hypothetical protein|nr:hypothetical protein [Burkholderiaceae bacterium]